MSPLVNELFRLTYSVTNINWKLVHKPLFADKKGITVQGLLAREIYWAVTGMFIFKSTVCSSAVLGRTSGLGIEPCLLL